MRWRTAAFRARAPARPKAKAEPLEQQIEAAEAALRAVEDELADPGAWSTPEASARSTQDRSAAAGAAPTWREVTFPSRITSSVGMDCTPKRCCSLGESSTLTFTSFRRPAMSVATCASAGLTMRHGPHQGAHRSTTTGTDARSATSAKVSSPASTIQGSGLWQWPQCGTPEAVAGTRFLRPQFGHRTISSDICSPARTHAGFSNVTVSSPSARPTRMTAPSRTSPATRARPIGVSTSRLMKRRSGRAP